MLSYFQMITVGKFERAFMNENKVQCAGSDY
jgi:hypothetical protein